MNLRRLVSRSNALGYRLPSCSNIAATLVLLTAWQSQPAVAQINSSMAASDDSLNPVDPDPLQGHGSVSLGFTDTAGNGLRITDGNISEFGTVNIHSLNLSIYYNLTDHWSVHLGIPFVSTRFEGPPTHCPTIAPPCENRPALDPQHPESQFIDDGDRHGNWQDWIAGVAYLTDINGYFVTPSLNAYVPSQDYPFFGNAAPGQRLWKIEPAIELAHQFDFTNIYYRIRYGYVFVEEVLNTSVDHHRLDFELGYFLNPQFTLRAFSLGRIGDGYKVPDLVPLTEGFTNELWYRHDQVGVHNYATAGIGVDYNFGSRYTLSASYQELLWGQTVFNFQHIFDLRLTRTF